MIQQFENHDPEHQRITFPDARFYTKDNVNWLPGVTTILNVIDKGDQYRKWLQSNGFNADTLSREAMEQGSHVHEGIQDFLKGKEIRWANDDGKKFYTKKEWQLISRFIDFFSGFSPKSLAVERILVSEKLGYGSQLDYVCEISGEVWLIDHKTGSLYDSAYMQLAALRELWNEFNDRKIDKCGVMHLESAHRGRDSKGKSIQGKGWKLVECENTDRDFEDFLHVQAIWKRKNPNFQPFTQTYPDRYSIGSVTQIELPD
jgi:hypothetical protein